MLYLISDTHFNHKNIIEYEDRPFHDVAAMNEAMIRNWNAIVGPDDTVIHLGDVGLGSESSLKEIVPQLNGHKILIRGNHDRKSDSFFYDCGFEEIHRTYIYTYWDGTVIYMSHTPESRPGDGRKYDLHFFGHVHTKGDYPNVCRNGACLCVERWGYKPIPIDKLISLCKTSNILEERI